MEALVLVYNVEKKNQKIVEFYFNPWSVLNRFMKKDNIY